MMSTDCERLTVKEAATVLGMTEDYIRFQMRKGTLPIGIAIKGKGNSFRYLIFKRKLDEFIGR